MGNQIRVHFRIESDDIVPEDISRAVGVDASKTRLRGELVAGRGGPVYKRNLWELSSEWAEEFADEVDIPALVERMVRLVGPGLLSRFRQELESKRVSVVVYCEVAMHGQSGPVLRIEPEIIRMLAAMNATLDTDVFVAMTSDEGRM